MYEERNFMIFDITEVNSINFDHVLETSSETLRLSIDGSRSFVKWDGPTPDCVNNLITKSGPYSYSEMLEILNGLDWNSSNTITEI
jgi:hypothetical protein